MATIRQRGKVWQAEVCINGVRESATRDTKTEAKVWAAQRETELRQNGGNQSTAHTLDEALVRYITEVSPSHKGHSWELKRIAFFRREFPRLCAMQIRKITTDDLLRWRDARLKLVTSGSVLREISLLSAVFNIARKEWKWISDSPFTDLTKPVSPQHRDRRISQDEIDRICLALGLEQDRPPKTSMEQIAIAFLFALETAMRSGEIRGLTWDCVNISERYVILSETKNGTRRKVPLSKRAIALLDLMRGIDQKNVFTVNDGSFVTLFRKARDRCNIDNLRFHDTRHEALTRLAQKLPVLDLARMVGHRDPRSLMIYYNATPIEIASLLD